MRSQYSNRSTIGARPWRRIFGLTLALWAFAPNAFAGILGFYDLVVTSPALPVMVSESASSVDLTIQLVGAESCMSSWGGVTWDVALDFNGDAQPDDVGVPMPTNLSFSDTGVVQVMTIPIIGDLQDELDESFEVTITPLAPQVFCVNPSGPFEPNLNDYRVNVTILDDDLPVQFSVLDKTVVEGDAGSPNAEVTVQMIGGPLGGDVTLDWMTNDGTATVNDNDYLPAAGTVTIFAGTTEGTIFIPVVGDTTPEPDEFFTVDIFNPSAGTILDDNAIVTILDDDSGPPIELEVLDVFLSEGDSGQSDAKVNVVMLNGPSQAPVTFDWSTFDGTATAADGDFQAGGGSEVIQPGFESVEVLVPVFGDTQAEPDEFFEVKILNVVGADVADDRGDVTILNDDADLKIRILDAQQVEGNVGTQAMIFTVEAELLGAGRGGRLPTRTVDFETVSGTATAGQDFIQTSGTLTFENDSPQTIQVDILGDTTNEIAESFFVRLSNPDNLIIEDDEATGLILNDDSVVGELTVVDSQVQEGDEGTVDMVFEVHLAPALDQSVQVMFETLDGSAVAGSDYLPTQGRLVFQPGDTVQTLSVPVVGDTEVEADEAFRIRLLNPTGAVLADGTADGLILNDDESLLPSLSLADATVSEGDFGTSEAPVTATLSSASNTVVEVSFTTVDGSAVGGSDYVAASGTLTFPPGETQAEALVTINGDVVEEGDEVFTVQLSEAVGAEIVDGEARVTIIGDDQPDPPPVLSIDDARVVEGDEGQATAIFNLRLEEPAKARIMVDFTTRDGTALASDNDYVPASGRLDFDEGDQAVTIQVTVNGDTTVEDDETFFVDLSLPDGAELGDASAQCVIENDDSEGGGGGGSAGSIRLIQADSAMEGAGPAIVQVERFGGNVGAASVLVSTVNGSAVGGQDFQALSRRIQWASGQAGPQTLEIPILDDAVREDPESFGVAIRAPTGATLQAPVQIQISVVDDDVPMSLEIIGEAERTASVRTEEDFQVRVLDESGDPVAGAAIQWAAEGQARPAGEGRTVSDGAGLVTQTVIFDVRPGDAAVTATLVGTDVSVSFAMTVEGDLGGSLGGSDDPDPANEQGLAQSLDESCAEAGTSRHAQLCDYIYNQAGTQDQAETVQQLTPRAALAQAQSSLRTPTQQVRNVTSRLSALRSGTPGAGSAFSQLAFVVQGDGLSLGLLQRSVTAYQDESKELDDVLSRALQSRRTQDRPQEAPWALPRGGAAGGDEDSADDLDTYDSTESPCGFFVNGRASFGDAPRRGVELGYDFSTQGLTAGIDYRVSNEWVVGASLGYSRSDSDVVGAGSRRNGGSIDSEGTSLSLFTSWYRESFYLDGMVLFGQTDFDIERNIGLPVALNSRDQFTATAAPDGDELSIHVGFGYDFRVGEALGLTGFINGSYVKASIDGYTESGADVLNMTFDDQDLESLLAEVGVELSYPYSVSWGVLQPLVRFAFLREFEDDPQVVRARFAEDPTGRAFRITSERPDRSYLNVALGLTATLERGWASYVQYDTDLEREDLDIYTLTGGFRFQF